MKKYVLFFFAVSLLSYVHAQDFSIKVACAGNSITEGYGRDNSDSYPNQLDVLLGDKYDVQNFGVGGRTMGGSVVGGRRRARTRGTGAAGSGTAGWSSG